MAAPPLTVYAAPGFTGKNHQRRGSGGRPLSRRFSSSSSSIPTSPIAESPRTYCPRDGDAFSYDPAHLIAWYMPQDLWIRLPPTLLSCLAQVQHAGAAVLTGFARLDNLRCNLHTLSEDDEEGLFSDPVPTALRNHRTSNSTLPSTPSLHSTPSSSNPASPRPSTPSLPETPATPVINPFFGPSGGARSFTIPLDPSSSYYAAELKALRSDALVRLRHKARKVDMEWHDCIRTQEVIHPTTKEFEEWWSGKKSMIRALDDRGKQMGADWKSA